MNVLDLFSGIGGFSLGLERAGMRTVQFVEIDPFCRRVLAKHWPDVPCHDDIRTFHAPAGFADVIAGGFPCQDISSAGYKVGIGGSRSGLWSEYARLIGEVRPRYVVVENVAALLARGMGTVLGDLAALGYDTEWHCIPAAAIGAPHGRDRLWLVGYANSNSEPGRPVNAEAPRGAPHDPNAASRIGPLGRYLAGAEWERELDAAGLWIGTPEDQPDFLGVVDGIPERLDRLRALGNSIVPAFAEICGRAIMRAAATTEGSRHEGARRE